MFIKVVLVGSGGVVTISIQFGEVAGANEIGDPMKFSFL